MGRPRNRCADAIAMGLRAKRGDQLAAVGVVGWMVGYIAVWMAMNG